MSFLNLNNDKDKNNEEEIESIIELGTEKQSDSKNIPKNIQFLTIIGEIEGHNVSPPQKKATKYEHIIPLLIAAMEDPNIKGIFIMLNTIGGDVEAGLALAEMINSIDKPTVSLVLGGGHSIGVPLATASDYSFIVPSASMTIHPIRTTGLVISGPQTFRYFEKMQQRIIDFILRTSKIDRKVLMELMYATDEIANDVGTILIGQEAVEYGLIDDVGGFSKALNKLKSLF
ncbi:Clp protease [Anaerosalibacter bizertensis]|uniref:Clp protease n=1 Tax=Anaerosalibacter bizertensis TaxID=932217 RepID=A0A844FFY5_9FIRM|nr:ATP-dependent Clp protease proteolytic subunit [Anaerosalibacter bizertensis]MBU5293243.1 ATP-dependent Clp protease proteolytic subunit [Anaerosalibacter bizertensis]MBV1818577.1 ATP-dependent Clp protease proteolytic subunit [Bacteroidales bacterium MSK.15.36]MSS42953.1 Clp protease [Anaerosalibacter bizertensis]HHV27287.1 Clp protease [Tissierellia bacterium]